MIWQDILITRDVSEGDIAAALATVFGVDDNRILVVADLVTFDGIVTDDIHIICERRHVAGDFVLQLSIYLRDDPLERFIELNDDGTLIGRLCQIWSCAALMSDDSVAPYSWLLVRSPGDIRPVQIDSGLLDDDDAWVLVSVPEPAGAHPPMD